MAMNDNDINNNPNNSYATPPIHPKLTLRHILNSTLNSGAGSADASLRDRRQQPAAGSAAVPAGSNRRPPLHRVLPDDPTTTNTTAVTGTAATRGSASSRRIESSALPRTHYHRAVATVASQQQQQQQHPSSFPTHPATRFRTRNRALSNLSIVSFPSPAISECQQSRRPSTRAAASSTLGDENKIGSTARSSKNGGLALRNRDTNVSSFASSSTKGGKPDLNAGNTRRRALADSSNKVPQHAAGGKGSKGAGGKDNLVIVIEDDAPSSKAPTRPGLTRRTTRSSLTKSGNDEDVNMDVVEAEAARPIKSMRQSNATTSSKPSSSKNAALSDKSTNIPRRSSATVAVASTKNAGLRKSLKSSTAAVSSSVAAVAAPEPVVEVKKSTKNEGLRLKREIQALESDSDFGNNHSSGRKSSNSSKLDEEESRSARADRHERRRSKRLRQSDPNEEEDSTGAAAAIPVPSTSTSAAAHDFEDEEQGAAKAGLRSYARDKKAEDNDSVDHDDEQYYQEEPKDAGWEDLDIGDEEDPLMVTEYVVEIHEYMKELELQTRPDPHYMDRQSEVNWKMRSILVDWLIEVHGKFRLLPETIFLAVNIMDRFLSIRTVSLVKLQLVGIVSLQIASKYEEVVCPSVSSFLYMTDGCYTEEQLLEAERYVLKQIDFDLSYPNPINFLRRISKADNYDIQTRTVAKYFIEMSCVERKFIKYTPSMIAAAGMWLARKVLDKGYWDPNLIHYSTYSQLELLPCAQLMLDYVLRRSQAPGEPNEHPHFHKKYSAKKFYKAAEIVRQWAERRYLLRVAAGSATPGQGWGAVMTLFNGLEGGGRLEEWEEEGEEIPEVDYE